MGRLGFGPKSRTRTRTLAASTAPLIAPSAAWNGLPGSGFSSLPADPVRSTAKPALRILAPPNQYYTQSLLVGVYAGANNAGSLYDNFGLEMVIVHYEGTRVFITEPTITTFDDANGRSVSYFGWWVKLRHDGRNGHGNIYFEAVPKDATMQRRVIGPFQFSPQAAAHDASLTVAASGAIVAGSSYQTLATALDWCRLNGKSNPLITITEAGSYDLSNLSVTYQGQGYATITANAPVTITRPAGTPLSSQFYRPRYVGLRFRGSNITIDFMRASEYFGETTGYSRKQWLDGCKLTNSAGRYSLINGQPRNGLSQLFRDSAWFTECEVTALWNVCCGASLVRGCTFNQCWSDLGNGAVLIGNRVTEFDSMEYRAELNAMTVSYTGAEATATLAISGNVGSAPRTLTAKYGANTTTYVVNKTEASAVANANYWVRNVVDWLNTLPGWSATLGDDTRAAVYLTTAGNVVATGDTNVRNISRQFVTMIDVHSDFAQHYNQENFVIAGNICVGSVCQNIFFKDGYARDALVLNNAFHNKDSDGQSSQLAAPHSHVVIAHNSASKQGWWLRTDFAGTAGGTSEKYNPDAYSLFANNVAPTIIWGNTVDADLAVKNNHLLTGASAPNASIGTTIGGTATDVFESAQSGNFTAQGALLANPKIAVVRRRGNAPFAPPLQPAGYDGTG